MKKLIAAVAVLMTILLVSCGSSSGISTQTSSSKSMVDSLSGTYVGKNGSALTLFPDGTSEYYYMLYSSMNVDKGAGNWSYKDGTLTWMYNGKPVTATINEQSALSFTLEQTDGWIRERFIKASDSTENKSVDQYRKILRNTLNRPEMDNFDAGLNKNCTVSGLSIPLPFYWNQYDEDYTYLAELSESEESVSTLSIYPFDVQCSQDTFRSKALDLWNSLANSYESTETLIEPSLVTIGNLDFIKGKLRLNIDGTEGPANIVLVNNPNIDIVGILQFETENTIFDYNADFEKTIQGITVSDSTESDVGRGENSITSNTPAGVTPELKAFLDSYEAFMEQYIAFMQKYENSDDTYAMLSDYLDMMQQYADFTEKIDQYDTDKMSAADSAYYLEVTTRVAKKLYSAAIQ